MLAAESNYLFFRCLHTFFEDDEGCDLFAVERVRNAYGCGCGNSRVFVEHFVNLARVDVLAAANNHVGLAVNNVEKAARITVAYVARVKPAVAKSVSGRVRVLVIALQDVLASHDYFAEFTISDFPVISVNDLHLVANRHPARTRTAALIRRIESRATG